MTWQGFHSVKLYLRFREVTSSKRAVSKHQLTKQVVQVRLQGVEAALAKLVSDYDAATYRQNKLVKDAIDNARKELETAYEHLFEEKLQEAYGLCGVSWLRINFGQQMFDADAIEHLLGESDYLELTEFKVPWESKVKQYFGLLEAELFNLRTEIAKANNRSV